MSDDNENMRGILVTVVDLEDVCCSTTTTEIADGEYCIVGGPGVTRHNLEIVDGENGTKTHLITLIGVKAGVDTE